jgi:hypothetical protein
MRGLAVLFIALQKGQSNREKPSSWLRRVGDSSGDEAENFVTFR